MKFLLKIVLLILLIFLMVNAASSLFTERNKAYMAHEDYLQMNESVSIAILGSSHAVNGIDPRIIELETGAITFNFADEGQKMVSTVSVLGHVLKNEKPQLVILDVFYGNIALDYLTDEKVRENQYNTLDYLPFGWEKLKAHKEVFGVWKTLEMFPTLRRHAAWPKIIEDEPFQLDEIVDYSGGFFSNYRFLPKRWEESYAKRMQHVNQSAVITKDTDLSIKQIEQLEAVIQACDSHNVPLLFVSCPFNLELHSPTIREEQAKLIQFLKDRQQHVLDLSKDWAQEHVTKQNYANFDHLNTTGALLTSQAIAAYVIQNFKISSDKIKNDRMQMNRYAVINDPQRWAKYFRTFPPHSIEGQTGIRSVSIYQPYAERSEIVMELDSVGTVFPLRLTHYPTNAVEAMGKPIVTQKPTNLIEYKGKGYLVAPLNQDMDSLAGFEIRKGGKGFTPVLIFQGELNEENDQNGNGE